MRCRHCGASNAEEDHRCQRCARRLHLHEARQAPEVYPAKYPVSYGSAVPERYPAAVEQADRPAADDAPAGSRRTPYQRSLFPTGRVVAFEQYSPQPARRSRTRVRLQEGGTRSGAAVYQQSFDWSGEWSGSANRRRSPGTQEAVRYCNAPVAAPLHRAAAAAIDYTLVAIAAATVLFVVYLALGAELVNLKMLPYFGALAFILGGAYKALWAVSGVDSPGLRWTRLRTLNFDGLEPAPRERVLRVATGCFSLLSGALGLLWSLADEETLTWHDHMSKTFLTAVPGD